MRDYPNDTIAVSLTVRHTTPSGVVEHTFEHAVRTDGTFQAEWLNRRITAAVDTAVDKVLADFNVTDRQAQFGRVGDFVTALKPDTSKVSSISPVV